jgi:hypothetical protein
MRDGRRRFGLVSAAGLEAPPCLGLPGGGAARAASARIDADILKNYAPCCCLNRSTNAKTG